MSLGENHFFAHERLEVYQESLAFVARLTPILEGKASLGKIRDQLDRASISIPLNIAEGNGKFTPSDRCRFLDVAHGSALECAGGLDVLVAKGRLAPEQIHPGKERLQRIVRMLIGLIKSTSNREYQKRDELTE